MIFPHGGAFLHPQTIAQKTVIFLHGYGANGANLIDLGNVWKEHLPPCVFWAPDAIEPCQESMTGFQWFPLYDRTLERITPGLNQAKPIVAQAIKDHIAFLNLKPSDSILVGFSQGAMLSLELLWHIEGLGGVIAYSGRSYDQHKGKRALSPTPVLLVHGTKDAVVPFYHLENAKTLLMSQGFDVSSCVCEGVEHFIDKKGLEAGLSFLKKVFF
jgi:phospholipase/carboxylesterase